MTGRHSLKTVPGSLVPTTAGDVGLAEPPEKIEKVDTEEDVSMANVDHDRLHWTSIPPLALHDPIQRGNQTSDISLCLFTLS